MANPVNIFNSNQVYKGAFHVGYSRVSFGTASADHLVQNINYQYAQQVQMIYELGSTPAAGAASTAPGEQNVYYAGGRASGTASLARIITSRGTSNDDMLTAFNNICKPSDIKIAQLPSDCLLPTNGGTVSPGSGNAAAQPSTGSTTKLKSAILQSLQGSMETQSAMFTQQMSFMFLNMTSEDGVT